MFSSRRNRHISRKMLLAFFAMSAFIAMATCTEPSTTTPVSSESRRGTRRATGTSSGNSTRKSRTSTRRNESNRRGTSTKKPGPDAAGRRTDRPPRTAPPAPITTTRSSAEPKQKPPASSRNTSSNPQRYSGSVRRGGSTGRPGSTRARVSRRKRSWRKNATDEQVENARKRAAETILKNLDRSVKPCDNFYGFACGNFRGKFYQGRNFASMDDEADEELDQFLIDELQKVDESASHSKLLKLARTLHDKCTKAKEEDNGRGARALLKRIESWGGWPILHDDKPANEDEWKFNVTELSARIMSHAMIYLEEEKRIIRVEHASSLVSYLRKDAVKRFSATANNIVRRLAEVAGLKLDQDRVQREIDKMAYLDRLVDNAYKADDNDDDHEFVGSMKCVDLPKLLPNFDWKAYLTLRLPSAFHRVIGDIECKYVDITTIKNYGVIMQTASPRALANYFMYSYVLDKADVLTIYDPGFASALGENGPPTCMHHVYSSFKYALSAFYVQRRFGTKKGVEEFRNGVRVMIRNIREAYVDRVKEKTHIWMDETVRQQTIKQLNRIKHVIAADDIHFDEAAMNKYYGKLRINANDDFLSMYFTVEDWLIGRQLADALDGRKALSHAAASPAESDAHYSPIGKHIVISAAMLMPPHYDPLFPLSRMDFSAVNYGNLGHTLTHELTHALDDLRFYDEKEPEMSWDYSSYNKYNELMEKLEVQYSNFFDPHLDNYVNGKRTLRENIADNILPILYKAYKKALQARDIDEEELPLPGLEDYTMDQIFFIRHAQFYCMRFTDVMAARVYYEDAQHAPSVARVHVPIQNAWSLFQRVFQCPPNAKLWPRLGDKPITW